MLKWRLRILTDHRPTSAPVDTEIRRLEAIFHIKRLTFVLESPSKRCCKVSECCSPIRNAMLSSEGFPTFLDEVITRDESLCIWYGHEEGQVQDDADCLFWLPGIGVLRVGSRGDDPNQKVLKRRMTWAYPDNPNASLQQCATRLMTVSRQASPLYPSLPTALIWLSPRLVSFSERVGTPFRRPCADVSKAIPEQDYLAAVRCLENLLNTVYGLRKNVL